MCKTNGLPAKGNKHDLVKSLALHNREEEQSLFQLHYNGEIKSLPQNLGNIKKLSVATLKYILKSHSHSLSDNKDELVLRIFLLRHGRPFLGTINQANAIKNAIDITKTIISEEVKKYFSVTIDVRRVQKNRINRKHSSSVPVPENIECPSDLHTLFEPLEWYINNRIYKSNTDCISIPVSLETLTDQYEDTNDSTYDTFLKLAPV